MPYPVYVFPNRRQRHRDAYINAGPQRAFRAPGHPQACFITEVVIDELADRLRMDPLELRMRNLQRARAGQTNRAVAQVLPDGRRKDRLGQASSDRRSGGGPDQARHGLRGEPWAGAGSNRTRADCADPP